MDALKKTFTGKRSSSEATEGRAVRGEVRGRPGVGWGVGRWPWRPPAARHSRATACRPRRRRPPPPPHTLPFPCVAGRDRQHQPARRRGGAAAVQGADTVTGAARGKGAGV